MDAQLRFTRGGHVAAEVGGEVFLIDPEDGEAFRLGGSGPRMWQLLLDGQSIRQVASTIAGETSAAPEAVEHGVVRFVQQLVDIGALAIADPGER